MLATNNAPCRAAFPSLTEKFGVRSAKHPSSGKRIKITALARRSIYRLLQVGQPGPPPGGIRKINTTPPFGS
jgi:hypothetical protein